MFGSDLSETPGIYRFDFSTSLADSRAVSDEQQFFLARY